MRLRVYVVAMSENLVDEDWLFAAESPEQARELAFRAYFDVIEPDNWTGSVSELEGVFTDGKPRHLVQRVALNNVFQNSGQGLAA